MTQACKGCPRCRQMAPLHARQCQGCGHVFRTQFAQPAAAPTQMFGLTPLEVALARQKSYSTHAVGVFVLYFVLWIPGFVANWLFLREAEEQERLAGVSLPGVNALRWMLWSWVVLVGVVAVLILVALVFAPLTHPAGLPPG